MTNISPIFCVPRAIHLAQGGAEGRSPLNAFDNALLDAGVHNLNLIRVTSIVPKDCSFGDLPPLPVGTLTPAVYAHINSNVSGEVVSACIGAGLGTEGGVLMEYCHRGPASDAERVVSSMIGEAFAKRGWKLKRTLFATGEHKVDRLGSAVAVAILFDLSKGGDAA